MYNISASNVKKLRERTGAGILECHKALISANGDISLAINKMLKSGKVKAANKANRVAAEGIILIKISKDGKYGVIIEVNCETDFVVRDGSFKAFGDKVITAALDKRIIDLDTLNKIFEAQRTALVAKFCENIKIRRIGVLEGYVLGYYLHCARIGVIVSACEDNKELLKNVAMHIAARKPEYVNADDVPADVLAREHNMKLEIAMQSVKPYERAVKIVEGSMQKLTCDISLTCQHFVRETSNTVGKLLSDSKTIVNHFIRFEVGECILKE